MLGNTTQEDDFDLVDVVTAPEEGTTHHQHREDDYKWPEDVSSISYLGKLMSSYDRWTYSYMKRILAKGSNRKKNDRASELTQEDLFQAPDYIKAAHLSTEFWSIYKQEDQSFLRTLFRLAAPTFIPAGFCQLLAIVAQVSFPLMVMQLLLVLQRHPTESALSEGWPYIILIFAASILNALCNHRHHHLAYKSGVVIRAAVINAVYEHALHLSPKGKAGLSSGEITNLVALDTEKLFEVMHEGHLIWSCPLAMLIVAALLLSIMGPVTIIGIAILLLVIPVVKKVISVMVRIREKRVRVTDERVEIITAMLKGIKVTKLSNYEEKFKARIGEVRAREMKLVRKEQAVWALSLVLRVVTPVVASAATFAAYVLVSQDNVLTAPITFTTMMLFNALRFPINYAGQLVGKAALGYQAACRISNFLQRETRSGSGNSDPIQEDDEKHASKLEVRNGTFVVSSSPSQESAGSPSFTLSGINISMMPGEIMGVAGAVGSGKSSLINALIGELSPDSGTWISAHGKVAYASQTPFILNATVKDNIIFGLPLNKKRYEMVLDACCLRPDLTQIGPAGDLTEIGERGITLSGGQKQRISIARAVYSNPDIAYFDDPLSALDADTAQMVFDNLFLKSSFNLLSSCAVILVTHAAHVLGKVDCILVLHEGKSIFYGSWAELTTFDCKIPSAQGMIDSLRSAIQAADVGEDGSQEQVVLSPTTASTEGEEANLEQRGTGMKGKTMTVEEREHGLSNAKTWLLWFLYAGGWWFVLVQFLLMTGDRGTYVGIEWWLATWTDAAEKSVAVLGVELPSQTEGMQVQYKYLAVYGLFFLAMSIFVVLRSEWAVTGGARCAERLFSSMTARVLRAPMSYFDTTPLGRILNRFTYDVEVIDITLTQQISILMVASSWLVASLVVTTVILHYMLLVNIFILFLYALILLHYRRSAADLKRLDAVSRSPIQALLAEGLDGAKTIRVFDMNEFFLRGFQESLDQNSSAMLNFISLHRWLGVRIESLGSIVTLAACLLVTALNDKLGLAPGLVGLLIIWTTTVTITLGFLIDATSEAEAAITSIERVNNMEQLPQEKGMDTAEEFKVDPSWPQQGFLEFKDVKMRYRDGLPLSLDCLTFQILPFSRVGVVGRTGAGKSSLITALCRLVEIESGSILLDGVDLATLGLSDVRGRAITVISQDPFLIGRSVRECLDPFGASDDQAILEALLSVHFPGAERGHEVLEDLIEEGGSNFSVGERQLLCLARALLAKPKVLVMDEATASIDSNTDRFIQDMLRTRFRESTLLTIAHRLNTIMDYDSILVMDKGRAAEFGSPKALLGKQDGFFTQLVNATGEESAALLKKIALRGAT